MLRGFTDSLPISCSGVEDPNKTHARNRATCMAGSFTALLNHLLTWLPSKRLCTLCCSLHAPSDSTNGARRIQRPDYILATSAATRGHIARVTMAFNTVMFIEDNMVKLGSANMPLGCDERRAIRGYCLGRSRLPSGRLPVHRVEDCLPDILLQCCCSSSQGERKGMWYSRALPRETVLARYRPGVVRRASWRAHPSSVVRRGIAGETRRRSAL
jgi:hypothetical protein